MTTKYLLKRCNTLSFASSFKYIEMKFTPEELAKDNVIFISDKDTKCKYEWGSNPISIDEMKIPKSKKGVIIVELARNGIKTVNTPVEDDGDLSMIEDIDYSTFCDDEDKLAQYKDALINFILNNEYLEDKKLSKDFIEFILFVYPNLNDGNIKLSLLNILHENQIQTMNLEMQYPIKYKEEKIKCVNPIPEFSDIKIVINKNDPNTSSNSAVYKPDKEELKKATLGNSTQLEAFSKNKFTVIHNKKSANIDNRIFKQNHDVLNSLARNGVVCSPDTGKLLSIRKLINKLHNFEKFDIIFVHPSYELKITRSEFPSELIEPSYIINEGELLAVVYRYIIINFFGYCSVFSEGMEELEYLI